MVIPAKQLLHLRVETESGEHLGEVSGFDVDIDQHLVMRYLVKSSHLPKPFATELVISRAEVKSITAEKMIVEDGAVPAANVAAAPAVD